MYVILALLSIQHCVVYEVDDIGAVEICVKGLFKKYQYRKYKEIYQANINLIKKAFKICVEGNKKLTRIQKNADNKKLKAHKGGFNYFIDSFKE